MNEELVLLANATALNVRAFAKKKRHVLALAVTSELDVRKRQKWQRSDVRRRKSK